MYLVEGEIFMGKFKSFYSTVALLMISFSANTLAEQSEEYKLAEVYGCIACHALKPQKAGSGDNPVQPVGPSFEEIAQRFHANKDEGKYQELYRIVKYGSSPFRSKFQGQISGLAMPPNDETISDLDINRILVWVLTTNKAGK